MKQENQLENQTTHAVSSAYPAYYEDEISLIDLWLVILKRKKIILKVFVLFAVLAVLAAWVKKDKFEFTTTIEIGQIETGDGEIKNYKLIEPVDSVKAKLQNSYLPAAIANYSANYPDEKLFEINVDAPKSAQMLILKSKGVLASADQHDHLHMQAISPLLADLNRKVYSARKVIELKLVEATQRLEEYQNPITKRLLSREYDIKIETELDKIERLKNDVYWLPIIKGLESKLEQSKNTLSNTLSEEKSLIEQRKRLDELERLLIKQHDELAQQIKDMRTARNNVVTGNVKESNTITVLLLDSEMERLISRRAELEERIYYKHKNQQTELEDHIIENRRLQNNQKLLVIKAEGDLLKSKADRASKVALLKPLVNELEDKKQQALQQLDQKIISQRSTVNSLQASIDSVTESRVIVPFLKSIKPVGLTSKLVFIIVLFLGFIFAVIAAFIAEFSEKVKQRLQETEKA